MSEFVPFPKIARFNREVIVTEKIDGTNAQVFIRQLGPDEAMPTETPIVAVRGDLLIYAGSRSRWIVPGDDNFAFAAWVRDHADDLAKLGPGSHFGEWWGAGIQRRYGLDHKRFSLFNVSRWADDATRPACCHVVPELWRGPMGAFDVRALCGELARNGSKAAPGFMKPEGIVAFHAASGQLFKATLEKDEEPKGKAKAA